MINEILFYIVLWSASFTSSPRLQTFQEEAFGLACDSYISLTNKYKAIYAVSKSGNVHLVTCDEGAKRVRVNPLPFRLKNVISTQSWTYTEE